MNYFWAILLQVFLIALNAVFASAEIAVISMSESKLTALAAKGGKGAKKAKQLSKLTADPARFLSTIQVAITLAGFLGSAFAADTFAEPLVGAILKTGIGIPATVVAPVCVILITIILAFFNIVFGELVPKRVAMKSAEGVAKKLTGILCFVSVAFKPVVALLSLSTNGVLKLMGISPEDKGEEVTEEDIIMMAEVSKESGNIESGESELIKNIFEFSDLTVGQICTHRKDADILYLDQTETEWAEKIHSTEHTYYPVCGETADDVRGILFTKAYFRLEDKTRENLLKQAIRQPTFVYENTPANKLFEQMKKSKEYFAVVMDEYGGVAGIVTIHDLLEAIVGDMDEKDERAEYEILSKGDNVWEIHGLAPYAKVAERLGIEEPEEDYETFSGYVCSLLGSLPDDGTTCKVDVEGMRIEVLRVEQHCITKMRIRVLPPAAEE